MTEKVGYGDFVPTARQAGKWRRKMGIVYKTANEKR